MILTKQVSITISNNGKYYRDLGYGVCKQRDIILVDISDLTSGSSVSLDVVCDDCGDQFKRDKRFLDLDGRHYCKRCSYDRTGEKTSERMTGVPQFYNRGELNHNYRKAETWEKEYKKLVTNLTNANYKEFIDTIDPNRVGREFVTKSNSHHLDHIISIKFGIENNIDYRIISCPYNLRMLESRSNLKKSGNCHMTIDELMELIRINNYDINRDVAIDIMDLKRETDEERNERKRKAKSESGKRGAEVNRQNGTGLFGITKEQRSINSTIQNAKRRVSKDQLETTLN